MTAHESLNSFIAKKNNCVYIPIVAVGKNKCQSVNGETGEIERVAPPNAWVTNGRVVLDQTG